MSRPPPPTPSSADAGESLLQALDALESRPSSRRAPGRTPPPSKRGKGRWIAFLLLPLLGAGATWLYFQRGTGAFPLLDKLTASLPPVAPSAEIQQLSTRLDALETILTPVASSTGTAVSGDPVPLPPAAPSDAAPAGDPASLELRVQALESALSPTQSTLQSELNEIRSELAQLTQNHTPPAETSAAENPPPSPQPAETPTDTLTYLQERDRLTAYADKAIADGDKNSWDQLLLFYADQAQPERLRSGAKAELMRARSFFLMGPRLGSHQITPSLSIPGSSKTQESDLEPSEIAAILVNKDLPWQDRARAAMLLGQVKHPDAERALYDSIVAEKNLDVIREATISLGQLTGYRGEIFDIGGLQRWWENRSAPVETNP